MFLRKRFCSLTVDFGKIFWFQEVQRPFLKAPYRLDSLSTSRQTWNQHKNVHLGKRFSRKKQKFQTRFLWTFTWEKCTSSRLENFQSESAPCPLDYFQPTSVTFGKLDDLGDLLKSKGENVEIFDGGDFYVFAISLLPHRTALTMFWIPKILLTCSKCPSDLLTILAALKPTPWRLPNLENQEKAHLELIFKDRKGSLLEGTEISSEIFFQFTWDMLRHLA